MTFFIVLSSVLKAQLMLVEPRRIELLAAALQVQLAPLEHGTPR